jgi:hypothetical protein
VCLLHEDNAIFAEIDRGLAGGEQDCARVRHEIDMARRYFVEHLEGSLGDAAFFA